MTARERFPRRAGVAMLVAREVLTPRMLRATLRCDAFRDEWPIEQPGEIITLLFVPPERADRPPAARLDVPARRAAAGVAQLHGPPPPPRARRDRRRRRAARAARTGLPVGGRRPAGHMRRLRRAARGLRAARGRRLAAAVRRRDRAARDRGDPRDARRSRRWWPSSRCTTRTRRWPSTYLPAGSCGGSTARARPPRPPPTSPRRCAPSPSPPAPGQAWGAAESRIARDLRAVLREERGIPRSHAHARGYWLRNGDWLDDEE